MYCSKCGNEIKDGEDFCPKCGKSTHISTENNTNGSSIRDGSNVTGFVLGIISCLAWFLPIVGFPVSIIGLIFSVKENKKPRPINSKFTQAEVSMILNTAGLIITIVNSFIGALIGTGVLK